LHNQNYMSFPLHEHSPQMKNGSVHDGNDHAPILARIFT
jgi:hypothetical protein